MEYKLTTHYQHSKKEGDGKRRNKLLFFLNGILIFEQKVPFDETYDHGYQNRTYITDIYLLDGNIYQKRQYNPSGAWWRSRNFKEAKGKIREVKYPVSKKILSIFNIPKGMKIFESQ